MRTYKRASVIELPEKAKIFTPKKGKYKGRERVRFKSKSGKVVEGFLSRNRESVRIESKYWYIAFTDNSRNHRELKAFTSEAESRRMGDKIKELLDCVANSGQPNKELREWLEGLPEAIMSKLVEFELARNLRIAGKTLAEYIELFRADLASKEITTQQVKQTVGAVKRLCDACGFVTWSDVRPEPLKTYLDSLRDGSRGITRRTYNNLLKTAKRFCKWMVERKFAATSPLVFLKGFENIRDERHPRRALEPDDFLHLLEVTKTQPKLFRLTGVERSLIYRFAAQTGFRRGEMNRLTVQDFDFKNRVVRLTANKTKNRRKAEQPLPKQLALDMQQYVKGKLPTAEAFHITDKTSKIIQADLKAAGIPYVDNGEYFDFHSLRHQFASALGELSDMSESERRELTRHLSQELLDRYSHVRLQRKRAVVDRLPDLTQPSRKMKQNATGTDDRPVK